MTIKVLCFLMFSLQKFENSLAENDTLAFHVGKMPRTSRWETTKLKGKPLKWRLSFWLTSGFFVCSFSQSQKPPRNLLDAQHYWTPILGCVSHPFSSLSFNHPSFFITSIVNKVNVSFIDVAKYTSSWHCVSPSFSSLSFSQTSIFTIVNKANGFSLMWLHIPVRDILLVFWATGMLLLNTTGIEFSNRSFWILLFSSVIAGTYDRRKRKKNLAVANSIRRYQVLKVFCPCSNCHYHLVYSAGSFPLPWTTISWMLLG